MDMDNENNASKVVLATSGLSPSTSWTFPEGDVITFMFGRSIFEALPFTSYPIGVKDILSWSRNTVSVLPNTVVLSFLQNRSCLVMALNCLNYIAKEALSAPLYRGQTSTCTEDRNHSPARLTNPYSSSSPADWPLRGFIDAVNRKPHYNKSNRIILGDILWLPTSLKSGHEFTMTHNVSARYWITGWLI